MSDIAISVSNVSKCYRVFDSQSARLRHTLSPNRHHGGQEIWSLRDVSFDVKRGESVAIIGRNGSGKSTLLEIITGTLQPTAGSVSVTGRVAALLELGSGFNPEYTGRENVFLNGLLMGLTRDEVDHRFDDIAGFADIGDVLERPVKTYSSGMLVRLAFAVQVVLEPEILIVDEALSVGDYFFQQKCFARLRKMRDDGLTLLFVSHDMSTVRDLCSHAVYLHKGAASFVGDAKVAISHYFAESEERSVAVSASQLKNTEPLASLSPTADALPVDVIWKTPMPKEVGLLAVRVLDTNGQAVSSVRMGDTIKVEIYFRHEGDEHATIALTLKNRYDQVVFATSAKRLEIDDCRTGQAYGVLTYLLEMKLEAGAYSLRVAINLPRGANTSDELDFTDWIGPIQTVWDYESEIAPFLGLFGVPANACLERRAILGKWNE
jgi:lipopolysaccharide transport system ATP-binding protein